MYNPITPIPDPQTASQMYALAQRAIQSSYEHAQATIELGRLRAQVNRRQVSEDAYTTHLVISGATCTQDHTGRFVPLMNREVEWAAHLKFKPPFNRQPLYIIKLKGCGTPVFLDEKRYLHDSALLQAVEELPDVQIHFRRSAKTTATLLRGAINAHMQIVEPEFYGGWKPDTDGAARFYMFPSGTTHLDGVRTEELLPICGEFSPTAAAEAAKQFFRVFQPICDPNLCWTLVLWFHMAPLTSLLQQLGYTTPLSLCLFSDNSRWNAQIRTIFSLYGDPPICLDALPTIFSRDLAFRCDQALLIQERYTSPRANQNARTLTQTLLGQNILWASKIHGDVSLPLLSLPIILTSTHSALCSSPNTLLLELNTVLADIASENTDSFEASKHDYLREFLLFVQKNVPLLQNLLEENRQRALLQYGEGLNEICVQTLGNLMAVNSFVLKFFDTFYANSNCDAKQWLNWLVSKLEQTTWKAEDEVGLADRFIECARLQLMKGQLHATLLRDASCSDVDGGAILYDDAHLYFPKAAFWQVCAALDQSRPSVLNALNEAGLLGGKRINSTTLMTRVGILAFEGTRRLLPVYRLDRSAFDAVGDPLVFDGEVWA